MSGRGQQEGTSGGRGGGGGGWRHQYHQQLSSSHQSRQHHEQLHTLHQIRSLGGLSFTGGGDLGLATTSGSSSLLSFSRVLPSSGGISSFPSKVTSPGSFPGGSSGSCAPGGGHIIASCSQDSEVGCSDLSCLYPLTDDAILHNIIARYKSDQIYTFVGDALVSVNPYKKLALYTPEVVGLYRHSAVVQLPPHIFAMGDALRRGVSERHSDQILVATGESGAGKTEIVKQVLHFVTTVSPEVSSVIRQKLLQSNLLVEAFGNARTRRNDNSSRYAKYMEIEFDFKGVPVGGSLSCYLLEKFRVTSHFQGERNFHIFYQLLSGTDTQHLKSLRLQRNTENYCLLKSPRQHTFSDSSDDRAEYLVTKRAFDVLGLSSEEQLEILRIVASVLKLGNISFTPVNNIDGTEGCSVDNEYELYDVSELLRCDTSSLISALKSRTIETRCENIIVELSAIEAARGRDSLCRTLYSRLFSWLVTRINDTIKVKAKGRRRVLGLLDINGFETAEKNGFQQLIVNFCNEKLYQTITTVTLKEQQEEYIKEGLEWSHIEYSTNYSTVEILELSKTGILPIIEDVTSRKMDEDPDCVDDEILQQFVTTCGAHPNFEVKGARHQHCDNNLPADAFRIRHFAGAVTYRIRGFAKKNSDNLTRNLSQTMFECQHPILKTIFPEGNPQRACLKRPCSMVSQIQMSIGSLLRTLYGKTLRLVYCIKPNELKQPTVVETALLMHQIKYLGLLEQSRLRYEGWVFNYLHEVFLERYRMVSVHTWPSWGGSALEGCAIIMADLPVSPSQYTFGRTKIFIKSQVTVNDLEQYRRERLEDLAAQIQKIWRGFRQKQKFRSIVSAQSTIARAWRRWKVRDELSEIKHRRKVDGAARIIQYAYVNYQRFRFINHLILCPPNESPISVDWPPPSPAVLELSVALRQIHHKWRCFRYRLRFDQTSRNRMREKVTASLIFKDRKTLYTRSIAHPFIGDYVRLRHNAQWKRLATESSDQYVVFADMVNKIARSSGKFVPILLVLSTNSLLVLDHRTLQIKYRIPAADVVRITLSPFMDDIAVIHVKPPTPTTDLSGSQNLNPGCLFGSDDVKRKGDLVIQTCHIIEVVTKLFLVVQNAVGKPPEIAICTEFEANFGQNIVVFTFKSSVLSEVNPSQIRIVRRQTKMEVIL